MSNIISYKLNTREVIQIAYIPEQTVTINLEYGSEVRFYIDTLEPPSKLDFSYIVLEKDKPFTFDFKTTYTKCYLLSINDTAKVNLTYIDT